MLDQRFWRGRRVLVTGHTGFKGSWLSLWLLSLGSEVWGYSLGSEYPSPLFKELELEKELGKKRHYVGDVRNLEALKDAVSSVQPEIVIHLAAQPLVRRSYLKPIDTWAINVLGSLNLLEALKNNQNDCAVVMVTTDKVYANREWEYGYRENDRLGGHDPYSASKAAAELAIASWRASFCGFESHQTPHLAIATARAGNVVGGGDWSEDRIFPDAVRALAAGVPIPIRNPQATRPWQHVLEPLGGYMLLAEKLATKASNISNSFNFGPGLESNRSVEDLVKTILQYWPGTWQDLTDPKAPHEAGRLHLQIDKAYCQLGWLPRWDFTTTVRRTINWHQKFAKGKTAWECCQDDLEAYVLSLTHAVQSDKQSIP